LFLSGKSFFSVKPVSWTVVPLVKSANPGWETIVLASGFSWALGAGLFLLVIPRKPVDKTYCQKQSSKSKSLHDEMGAWEFVCDAYAWLAAACSSKPQKS
jgi:hypothetical protein